MLTNKGLFVGGVMIVMMLSAAQAQLSTLGVGSMGGAAAINPIGKILLVDGISFILQTDGASKICRAGGC